MNKTRLILFAVCFGLVFNASAQKNFRYKAFLNKIDSTGFYKISLGPDIIRKSNDDLSDIRLTDQNGNFVPYVTASSLPQVEKQKFTVFPEVKASASLDTGTSFVTENISKHAVNTLWIKLKNTAVNRLVNLSGSDDLKNWYAIEEAIPLQEAALNGDGTYEQSISFPASNYRYLKLLVNDKNKTPVKFLQAGEYLANFTPVVYLPISSGRITRKDSNKVTYITILFNDNYLINRLKFSISSPKFYKRDISVYQSGKQGSYLAFTSNLSSGTGGDIFASVRANKLMLQIDNEDNLPLIIDGVKAYQTENYIVSYLEKGKVYKLLTGDKKATSPAYDLKYFTDSISNIQQIAPGPIMGNGAYADLPVAPKHDFSVVIWIAIIVALLLLSLLTLKMMKEVNSKKA